MTTAAIFVQIGDTWARQDEDADGYPEDSSKCWMASVTSKDDALAAMGIDSEPPSPGCADYVYKFDEESGQMVFWAGKKRGWVPFREFKLKQTRERIVDAIGKWPNDDDEWELQLKFLDEYGVFAWELACDKKTRLFIVDENGVPELRDRKYLKFVKPGTALYRKYEAAT